MGETSNVIDTKRQLQSAVDIHRSLPRTAPTARSVEPISAWAPGAEHTRRGHKHRPRRPTSFPHFKTGSQLASQPLATYGNPVHQPERPLVLAARSRVPTFRSIPSNPTLQHFHASPRLRTSTAISNHNFPSDSTSQHPSPTRTIQPFRNRTIHRHIPRKHWAARTNCPARSRSRATCREQ